VTTYKIFEEAQMAEAEQTEDLDFNNDGNGFYYTSEKQIRRMDDAFILSKITEKYPDLDPSSSELVLKQVITVVSNDSSLMKSLREEYDIDVFEVFKTLYRNYEYVFTKSLIDKIQTTIKNKRYVRDAKRARKTGA
jgi:hypothetical protein